MSNIFDDKEKQDSGDIDSCPSSKLQSFEQIDSLSYQSLKVHAPKHGDLSFSSTVSVASSGSSISVFPSEPFSPYRATDSQENVDLQSLPSTEGSLESKAVTGSIATISFDFLGAIRSKYRASFFTKKLRLEKLWSSLSSSFKQEEFSLLHIFVHNLSGSGGTYGFPSISRKAYLLEQTLKLIRDSKLPLFLELFERVELQVLDLYAALLLEHTAEQVMPEIDSKEKVPLELFDGSVLIIDDDSDILSALEFCLAEVGLRSYAALDCQEAFSILDSFQPDLILLGVNSLGISGFDICKKIKAVDELEHIPLVFLSASDSEEQMLEAFVLGADDYITKPFYHKLLALKLKKRVLRFRKRRRNQRLLIGETFGRFELLHRLGTGGMGVVYLVNDPLVGKQRALKVLHPRLEYDLEANHRFSREIRVLQKLHHPNLVQIYDSGYFEHIHFYLMDYLSGGSLANRLLTGPLPVMDALSITCKIASGLHSAHSIGILHRDLKAENILFSNLGEPVLTDFGLVLSTQKKSKESSRLTESGMIVGTPYYMSPEHLKDLSSIDARSDVFSLGLLMYEMLVGKNPFIHLQPIDAMLQIMRTDVPSPKRDRTDLPEIVGRICLRATARERENRYSSALEVKEACRNAILFLSSQGLEV